MVILLILIIRNLSDSAIETPTKFMKPISNRLSRNLTPTHQWSTYFFFFLYLTFKFFLFCICLFSFVYLFIFSLNSEATRFIQAKYVQEAFKKENVSTSTGGRVLAPGDKCKALYHEDGLFYGTTPPSH